MLCVQWLSSNDRKRKNNRNKWFFYKRHAVEHNLIIYKETYVYSYNYSSKDCDKSNWSVCVKGDRNVHVLYTRINIRKYLLSRGFRSVQIAEELLWFTGRTWLLSSLRNICKHLGKVSFSRLTRIQLTGVRSSQQATWLWLKSHNSSNIPCPRFHAGTRFHMSMTITMFSNYYDFLLIKNHY